MKIRISIGVLALCLAWLGSTPHARAQGDRDAFLGIWGDEAQCARSLIQPGGSVAYEPFVIGVDWLQHGRVYCRLSWLPIEPRGDAVFTAALAQCGEDAVRDYLLTMTLNADDAMILRWEFPVYGPLSRCAAS